LFVAAPQPHVAGRGDRVVPLLPGDVDVTGEVDDGRMPLVGASPPTARLKPSAAFQNMTRALESLTTGGDVGSERPKISKVRMGPLMSGSSMLVML
jgi:hypothetical protein